MHKIQSHEYDDIKKILKITLDSYASDVWLTTLKNLNVTCTPGNSPSDIKEIDFIGLGTKSFWIAISNENAENVYRNIVQWVNLTNIIVSSYQ